MIQEIPPAAPVRAEPAPNPDPRRLLVTCQGQAKYQLKSLGKTQDNEGLPVSTKVFGVGARRFQSYLLSKSLELCSERDWRRSAELVGDLWRT